MTLVWTHAVGAGVVRVAWGGDKRGPVRNWRMHTITLPGSERAKKSMSHGQLLGMNWANADQNARNKIQFQPEFRGCERGDVTELGLGHTMIDLQYGKLPCTSSCLPEPDW